MKKKTLAIVGGGAVGLSSSIFAQDIAKDINIIVLEKMDRVGKKILATGNGRCNFTNMNASYKNYYGEQEGFSKYFLEQFSSKDAIDFFYKLGVLHLVLENGKVYPYSEQASSILDALRLKIDSCDNIEIKTEFDVKELKKNGNKFYIKSIDGKTVIADKVIFATGGLSSPKLGSDGKGIKILKALGHSCTKLIPSLVQLKTDPQKVKALKGIKITGNLKMYSGDKFLKEEFGEILFTEYGISGPCVFQLSTLFARYNNLIAKIDFMPNFSKKHIIKILKERKEILSYTNMENYFNGILNKRLGNIIAKNSGIEKLSFNVKDLTKEHIEKMASQIKAYTLNIIDTNGFNNSQVTSGGLSTYEFNEKTLESKLVSGLYCAGEILDVVGDCGGYNLQWAWSSSYVATKSCIKSMQNNRKENI